MSVLVKICGLKTDETVRAALETGADFIGFVFFEPSPRHIAFEDATRLAKLVRGKAKIVALMVSPDDDMIERVIAAIKPDFLQLHGSETPDRVKDIRDKFQVDVIKAISVSNSSDVDKADAYSKANIILFDAKPKAGSELPGGNGIAFDWQLLGDKSKQLDYMLSGGLTVETVAGAIKQTGCKMVDVSSGIETMPGEKDLTKIKAFIGAAKQAS